MSRRLSYSFFIRVFFVLIFSCQLINGQVLREFPEDISEYIVELERFMQINISEQDEEMLAQYVLMWQMNKFTEEEKQEAVEISNLLLKNRARQYPHFKLFLKTQMFFKESARSYEDYINWKDGFVQILEERVTLRTLHNYLESMLLLLEEQYVYKSFSTEWKFDQDNYNIITDEDGVRIHFTDINLICYSRRDSIKILNTSGDYWILDKKWAGNSGTVTWERAGFEADEVYASLNKYEIDMTRAEYSADSVVFIHKPFRDERLTGRLDDKVEQVSSPEKTKYPSFISYQTEFYIKNLYDNIDFSGGLLFSGARVIGTGEGDDRARLIFTRADSTLIQAESNYFVITKRRLRGIDTRVAIYVGEDSIYHPDLSFTYMPESRELTLTRTDNVTSRAAYLNTYHNVLMHFEELSWMIDEPYIYLSMARGSAEGMAEFQSVNFFSPEYYESLMGYDERHPLVVVYNLIRKLKRDDFSTNELADYMNRSVSATRHFLMRLASEGFLHFDIETDEARSLPRVNDYLLAFMGKIDYDVMDFKSRVSAPLENAYINLRNLDMTINGLPGIRLSTAQNVMIIPENQSITMKRNRSFQFNGVVAAGLFTFFGNNFFFNYDSFMINLQNVDSVKIKTEISKDNFGRPVYRNIRSKIENVTGELLIDRPYNKSGKEDYPEYPIFHSREPSYVYYDKPTTMEGAYHRRSFYFQVDPYRIDSLDNFQKEALRFIGTFHSADILPPIRERLRLQEDRSLGFLHQSPGKGYDVYKGKGTFYNELHLSDYGLHGKGKLTYLTSVINSQDFFFYPDSVNSDAVDFEIKRKTSGVEYPRVTANDINVHWQPYNDFMDIKNNASGFTIINNQNTLNGTLTIEPTGLKGAGHMDMTTAEMKSDEFVYRSNGFSSDTADFFLKSLKSSNFTVLTRNVNADIDYDRRKGVFHSNEDFTLVEFPENRYVSYLDYFEWNMNRKEFKMGTQRQYDSDDVKGFMGDTLAGPRYISVHPQQDSLNFVSSDALYDYENNLLRFNDVEYIRVADAAVYPNEGNVIVEVDAKMRTLYNSVVMADVEDAYHRFYDAEINIAGRKIYTGKGKYDYLDEYHNVFTIDMHTIKVDDSLTTVAEGAIVEQDSFYLSPKFMFQGKTYLYAKREHLLFRGGTRIITGCQVARHWLLFESVIKPDSIYIPISDRPREINRNNTYAGLMMGNDSVHIYPTWLDGRKNYSDRYIASANGYLTYDRSQDRFMIGQPEKLLDEEMPGDFITLRHNNCRLLSEGWINMGIDLWHFQLNSFGDVVYDFDSNSTHVDMIMALDFFIDESIQQIMALHLDTLAQFEGRAYIDDNYVKFLDEMLFQLDTNVTQDAETILFGADDDQSASISFPKHLNHTLLIRDLQMVWEQRYRAFRSYGNKFTIAAVGRMPVDLEVEGYVQVTRKRSGDEFDMFFKLDEHEWYYFGYTRGVLQTISSNRKYNDALLDMKVRHRKLRKRRGEKPYIYMISTHERMQRFLRQFNTFFHKETQKQEIEIEDVNKEEKEEEENFQNNFFQ